MLIDGVHECFTLEPRKDQSQGKPYCIPARTYGWVKKMSPHFGFMTIWLVGVTGFDDVEIHPGNFPKDTHACTLVGSVKGVDFVGHSDEEFEALMAKLPEFGTIVYEDSK